ncbi:hypothetical protein PPACK8108_LOCUS20766 [Phakopsora pachyrhizi]|uniref:mRNA 3'-end-processing protein n=1 Tax=Phakopsora pachyrhizi TaxID=170000 RepID=A0AAV0BJJ6_PHAPC|nr:hypothetical protein PPACK8108_LOCUS20766 [Phakopsora pachyrhizi]
MDLEEPRVVKPTVNRGKHEVGTAPPPPPPPPNQNCSITSTIVLKPDLRHIELDIEKHLKVELDIKLDSDAQLCPRFLSKDLYQNQAGCQAGPSCPYRHSTSSTLNFQSTNNIPNDSSNSTKNNNSNSLHSKTVCKHWLRGLCKKGSGCEFLHEYNLRTMPECWFFGKYGFCSNGDECMYLHVDERMRVLECMDFRRGFCPKGPICPQKHIRRPVCVAYLAGFCPSGKSCLLGGHPKFEVDPSPRGNPYINSFNPFDRPRGDPDRAVGAPRPGRTQQVPIKSQSDLSRDHDDGWIQTDSGPRKKRNLDEVTCFKCGQRGHYANTCPNPMVPGNRGGIIRGPGGRLLGEEDLLPI